MKFWFMWRIQRDTQKRWECSPAFQFDQSEIQLTVDVRHQARVIPNNDKNRTYSVVYLPKVEGLHQVRAESASHGVINGGDPSMIRVMRLEVWSCDMDPISPQTSAGLVETQMEGSCSDGGCGP